MIAAAPVKTVPKNRRNLDEAVRRVLALDKAGALIGKGVLADAMGMPVRTLQSYTGVNRRLPDAALISAAKALEAKCAEISAHAAVLRALASESGV